MNELISLCVEYLIRVACVASVVLLCVWILKRGRA